MEATVSLKDLNFLRVGDLVKITSEDIPGTWQGTLRRISDRIDVNTQTVKVFIQVGGQNLKEGMFLQGEVKSIALQNVSSIPRGLINQQNQVYLVKGAKLQLQEVVIARYVDNNALVKGLKNGSYLLNESSAEYYEGMKVEVKK